MKTNENKKGISLIVLIITILVMIILAAAIILNLDDTKIIRNANRAVAQNNASAVNEVKVAARAEWRVNEAKLKKEGYYSFESYLKAKLENAGIDYVIITEEGALNTKYTDENGDIAIIPEGFSVSTVTSEQTIEDGLVVVDKDGNEFVWVPVENYARFARTTKYKVSESITAPSSEYLEPYSEDLAITAANDLTGEYAEETKMRASVQEYKGFYIARYEAGLPEGKTTDTEEARDNITESDKPVSKKEAAVWNYIPWGVNTQEIGTEGAVYRARQMYKGSKSVVSTLCYGVQWDAALQFIATKDEDYPTRKLSNFVITRFKR